MPSGLGHLSHSSYKYKPKTIRESSAFLRKVIPTPPPQSYSNPLLGTTDNSGVEIKFRGELQYLITKMYEKDGVPLPMICIMLEGGSQSIEMALNSLRMGQPLVVIKGGFII